MRPVTVGRTNRNSVRSVACLLTVSLVTIGAHAKATRSSTAYPNELPHFKFYAKYLEPLSPYVSDREAVVRALGSDQGVELTHWRLRPMFVGEGSTSNGHASAQGITGRLASVVVRPKQRVSMLGIKFPPEFSRSLGNVSEINVSCDVYSDSFGLQYWIYSEDWHDGKKGDLKEIVYGPSEKVERQVTAQP
jgi:hypothetical protein